MEDLKNLLENNARWAERAKAQDPEFFSRLAGQQAPEYLWIGCSDSRVPANQIVDLDPGELFVHRNIANVAPLADVNCQSVIQFAVDIIKVRHIMLVGHYGCSGVKAALQPDGIGGLADHWLGHVREIAERYKDLIAAEPNEGRQHSLLCELNVLEQSLNLCHSEVVRKAWKRGQQLSIHGWIYRLADGRVRHLDFAVDSFAESLTVRESALKSILNARAKYYAGR